MNENRETPASRAAETPESSANPGAAIEETEATTTEVQDAVTRATSVDEAEVIVAEPVVSPDNSAELAEAAAEAERLRREQVSKVDTELNLEPVSTPVKTVRVGMLEEMPSAGPEDTGFGAAVLDTPARDGEIRISSDHPMAGFYTQTPTPPDIRGNRGAGILISLLATIGFSALLAGVMLAEFGITINPSRAIDLFFGANLHWVYFAAVGAFLAALVVLVAIVGRAGWWAYVLGGFIVAVLVWLATTLSLSAVSDGIQKTIGGLPGQSGSSFGDLLRVYGLSLPAIAAGVLAREVTVWFGAWIGARGRKMKARNAVALAEYEEAKAEAQVKQP
ncbi:Na+/H+ antiporter NhaA [Leucobacter coleopterorum]|uniref:Na+/H+ antiporter NhaA n=1 Tax=Leucobacter coleopterorum TaxID=2714933 RepID=A0ABX6JZB0_9MICO|nr:Na+/H+ antiporter NhaA [Leucobacter coleopterorum]QIM18120.1 Na+/H+ antiporter NhaA [Leucobacter coleopterorum]